MRRFLIYKYFLLLLMIVFIVVTSTSIVHATKPLPMSIAEETSFSGMIPLTESDLQVNHNKIVIDLIAKNELPIDTSVERKALITITYEIYNPTSEKQVKMTMPFLSRFLYFQNAVDVKVNQKLIETQLLFSQSLYNAESFTKYLEDFQYQTYQEEMYGYYQLKNDLGGYLYTLTSPITKGNEFYSGTVITFPNVPDDAIFFDRIQNKIYESGEIDYFFGTDDLDATCVTTEWKYRGGVFTGHDVLLESATITKTPIKLNEYLKNFRSLPSFKGPYLSVYQGAFFKTIDDHLESNPNQRDFSTYIISNTLNNYQEMAIEFDVIFESQKTSIIEISYLCPLFVGNVKHNKEFFVKYIPNAGNHWKHIENINVEIITHEKIIYSSLPYLKEGNRYSLSTVQVPDEPVSITLDNSLYKPYRFGCIAFSLHSLFLDVSIILLTIYCVRRRSR